MRDAVRDFCVDVAENLAIARPVVEFGSRPAPGQESMADLRPLFPGEFIGCDFQEGPGVDRVEDLRALTFTDGSVGTAICVDTLEHVADPLQAVREMHRVLVPGGVCAISSVMFFPVHDHPSDYWRFTPEGFALLLEPFESTLVLAQGFDLLPEGVFGVGIKGPAPGLSPARLPRTAHQALHWDAGRPVDFGPIRMSVRELWGRTLRETGAAAARKVRPRRG